jgi:hypothetical protein
MRKQKPTKNDKLYIFDITLSPDSPLTSKKTKVSRTVSILGKQSLYNFAEGIVDSFDFCFDHCFGFFDNLKNWTDSLNSYELFVDIPDVACDSPESKSVKKTKVQDLFSINDKMLFLFDYGDGWEFIIQLKKIDSPDMKKSYPLLIDSSGKAPEQYL